MATTTSAIGKSMTSSMTLAKTAAMSWYRRALFAAPAVVYRGLVEATSCMVFHFVGSLAPTPAANGIVLMTLVYYAAKMSGAHLNPAATLTFCLLGHTNPAEMLAYWIAQVTGCVMGALWIALLVPGLRIAASPGDVAGSGCFVPHEDLTHSQVFGWEAVGTFCFLTPIFSVVWYTQNKNGYGNTGPLIVGLSLTAVAMAVGPWTGAALNPARAVASPTVFRCPQEHNLSFYVMGQMVGAAFVPMVIIPWYGIASSPWYVFLMPRDLRKYFDVTGNWHSAGGGDMGQGQDEEKGSDSPNLKRPPDSPDSLGIGGGGAGNRKLTGMMGSSYQAQAPSSPPSPPQPGVPHASSLLLITSPAHEKAYVCVNPFDVARKARLSIENNTTTIISSSSAILETPVVPPPPCCPPVLGPHGTRHRCSMESIRTSSSAMDKSYQCIDPFALARASTSAPLSKLSDTQPS